MAIRWLAAGELDAAIANEGVVALDRKCSRWRGRGCQPGTRADHMSFFIARSDSESGRGPLVNT